MTKLNLHGQFILAQRSACKLEALRQEGERVSLRTRMALVGNDEPGLDGATGAHCTDEI